MQYCIFLNGWLAGSLLMCLCMKFVPNNSREIHTYVCAIDGHKIHQVAAHVWMTTNVKTKWPCVCAWVFLLLSTYSVTVSFYWHFILRQCAFYNRDLGVCMAEDNNNKKRGAAAAAKRHTKINRVCICFIWHRCVACILLYYRHVTHVYILGMAAVWQPDTVTNVYM